MARNEAKRRILERRLARLLLVVVGGVLILAFGGFSFALAGYWSYEGYAQTLYGSLFGGFLGAPSSILLSVYLDERP